mgnify:CR=1 FL=1
MGKGSNVQKKQAARARHEKEASKPQGGGGCSYRCQRSQGCLSDLPCMEFEFAADVVDRVHVFPG